MHGFFKPPFIYRFFKSRHEFFVLEILMRDAGEYVRLLSKAVVEFNYEQYDFHMYAMFYVRAHDG